MRKRTKLSKSASRENTNDSPILQKLGYNKILCCALQAHKDEVEWIWADICWIDKSRSAELQEPINSMRV
ncbi:hypothetical protein BJ170DRAFT_606117 [Xylariales sp. AK1849]|nr:hypothetical protein BJ170DRAFT_606117 [Xylariales sp. AK1849]